MVEMEEGDLPEGEGQKDPGRNGQKTKVHRGEVNIIGPVKPPDQVDIPAVLICVHSPFCCFFVGFVAWWEVGWFFDQSVSLERAVLEKCFEEANVGLRTREKEGKR
jgi:hypothetical protein